MAMDYIWLTDKLEGEYKEAFEKAEIYANIRNINEDMQNELLMELLDLFLTAQNEGKPVIKLIGSDLEAFCDSYFSVYTLKSHLCGVPKKIYHLLWFVFVFETVSLFALISDGEEFSLFQSTVDLSGYVCGLLVGALVWFLCNVFIRPFIFRWKWLTSGRFSAFVILLTVGMIAGGVILLEDYTLELPVFLILLVSSLYIVSYIIVRSIWRYRKYGSIRKEKAVWGKIGFRSALKETLENMPKDLVERFYKKNERRQKKGKEPMTPEEYMEVLHKENIRTRRGDRIGLVIVLLVVIGLIIQTALTSTAVDTLIFAVILFVVEIPAGALFRIGIRSTKRREEIVAECDRRKITILEYAEEQKEKT